jgi:hypothetical protein
VFAFIDGHAAVKQGAKWGIIDTTGRFTAEPKFDAAQQGRSGLYHVRMDGRDFWIDASGGEQPEPPMTYVRPPNAFDCRHGVRLIERDGRWGVADGDKELIAPRYRALGCFRSGIVWAPIDGKRQWCAVGPDGRERDRPACMTAHYPDIVSHASPEKFNDDPFENSVLWTRAHLEFAAGRRETPPQWVFGR